MEMAKFGEKIRNQQMQAATKNVGSIPCFEGENPSKHPKSPPAVGKEKNVHRRKQEVFL
jgi:hypothetical protein